MAKSLKGKSTKTRIEINSSPRKIMVITGRRAEYSYAKSILENIISHPKLSLQLVVTGNHLIPQLGYTIDEIRADGFPISSIIDASPSSDSNLSMLNAFNTLFPALTSSVTHHKPDIILVLTDLGHALAGAIVGSHLNIPVAHLHGGDVCSSIDEPIRHATTRFAHIHLPSSAQSALRLKRMGEEPFRIYQVGASSLDYITHSRFTPPHIICKKYHINLDSPILVVIQHPITTSPSLTLSHIAETLEALRHFPATQIIILYPNADAGGRQIISSIESYRSLLPNAQIYPSLPHLDYIGLLVTASVLVGNSSSGIVEAPSLHLPVVNIGSRQANRERSTNVIDTINKRELITEAIAHALSPSFQARTQSCITPYGDGNTGPRIAEILSSIEFTPELLQKKLTY